VGQFTPRYLPRDSRSYSIENIAIFQGLIVFSVRGLFLHKERWLGEARAATEFDDLAD
jgi:hypothetical protein